MNYSLTVVLLAEILLDTEAQHEASAAKNIGIFPSLFHSLYLPFCPKP